MMFGLQIPRLLAELGEWRVLNRRVDALRLEVDAVPAPSATDRRRWRTELDAMQADADKLR